MSESVEATMQHVEQLASKISTLDQARAASIDQLTYRIKQEYRAGTLSIHDLLAAYERLKANAGPRWSKAWYGLELPGPAAMRSLIAAIPNGPNGSWYGVGRIPSVDHPMPTNGQSVVYVLYDAENQPCYVGSSEQFRIRLKAHIKDGKPVTYWTAFPCPDRDAAYRLEDRLLKQYKPYLNIKNCA